MWHSRDSLRWSTLAVLFSLWALESGRAQPTDPEPEPLGVFSLTLQVTEVLVEVVVIDRRGEPVLGLGKDDFRLRLQGQPMEIESLRYHHWGSEPAETGKDLDTGSSPSKLGSSWPRHRYFILLFHDLIFLDDKSTLGLLSQRMRAGRGIRRWVRDEMQEGDLVAVTSYDSRLHLFQDFTPDRKVVLTALERVLSRSSAEPASPNCRISTSHCAPSATASPASI